MATTITQAEIDAIRDAATAEGATLGGVKDAMSKQLRIPVERVSVVLCALGLLRGAASIARFQEGDRAKVAKWLAAGEAASAKKQTTRKKQPTSKPNPRPVKAATPDPDAPRRTRTHKPKQ